MSGLDQGAGVNDGGLTCEHGVKVHIYIYILPPAALGPQPTILLYIVGRGPRVLYINAKYSKCKIFKNKIFCYSF